MHRHRAKRTSEACFSHCVAGWECNPGSHGNITERQECECGAWRYVNKNQHYSEASPWERPEPEKVTADTGEGHSR